MLICICRKINVSPILDGYSLYYECKETSEINNVKSFSEIIAENFGLPPLAFDSFESTLAVMDSEVFYDKFIEADFEEHYVPLAFEQVCKQFLIRKNRSGELADSFEKIGKYWYDDPINQKNGEFDVVTENDNSYIFYEAKFRDGKLDSNLMWNEIQQVNNTGLVCNKYGFFSKSGHKEIDEFCLQQLILYTLEDIYKE